MLSLVVNFSELKELFIVKKKCYDCPWGNGEGGCTIPGYCPDEDNEDPV